MRYSIYLFAKKVFYVLHKHLTKQTSKNRQRYGKTRAPLLSHRHSLLRVDRRPTGLRSTHTYTGPTRTPRGAPPPRIHANRARARGVHTTIPTGDANSSLRVQGVGTPVAGALPGGTGTDGNQGPGPGLRAPLRRKGPACSLAAPSGALCNALSEHVTAALL